MEHDGCRFYKAGKDDAAQKDSDTKTDIFGIFRAVVFSKKRDYKVWGKFKNQKEDCDDCKDNFSNRSNCFFCMF